jgi:hypothetical protein
LQRHARHPLREDLARIILPLVRSPLARRRLVLQPWIVILLTGARLACRIIGYVARGGIKVDCLAGLSGGPVVRFAAGPEGAAVLRGAFDRLAGGDQTVAVDGLELAGVSSIEFRQGTRGGLRSPAPGRLVFDGDRDQWEIRARLLDPLTQSAAGFQYLDYEPGGDLSAVVTTYPDGSF